MTAPNGYSKTDKVYYFALMPSNTILDEFYESIGGSATGVNKEDILIFGVAGGALYIPNEFTGIRVHKEWNDSNGATIAAPTTEIEVQLIQHTMKPDYYEVTVVCNNTSQTIQVPKSGIITVKTIGQYYTKANITEYNCSILKDGKAFGSVTWEEVWSASSQGKIVFTTDPITSNCTIEIIGSNWGAGIDIFVSDMTYIELDSVTYGAVSLNSSNNWSAIWEGLPSEDSETGNPYYYTVKEITQIDGYTTTYVNNNGIQEGEIAIVNTKDVETPEYSLPETGGSGTLQYISGGFLLMLVSILMYIKKQNQKRGKRI